MNKVISLLENELNKGFLAGARRQLDWERSAIVDYDYVESDRQFAQKPGETERFSDSRDLSEEARKWSGVEPRFRFFLDGSRRTYRVADVPLGSKCLPILAGQVGVSKSFNPELARLTKGKSASGRATSKEISAMSWRKFMQILHKSIDKPIFSRYLKLSKQEARRNVERNSRVTLRSAA